VQSHLSNKRGFTSLKCSQLLSDRERGTKRETERGHTRAHGLLAGGESAVGAGSPACCSVEALAPRRACQTVRLVPEREEACRARAPALCDGSVANPGRGSVARGRSRPGLRVTRRTGLHQPATESGAPEAAECERWGEITTSQLHSSAASFITENSRKGASTERAKGCGYTGEQQANPTGHTAHSVARPSENVPRGHGSGGSAGLTHWWPAGHGMHLLPRALPLNFQPQGGPRGEPEGQGS